MLIAMLIATTARRLNQVGLVAGGLGALIIAWGALRTIQGATARVQERTLTLIGTLLIALAFGMQLLGMLSAPKATTPASPGATPTAAASAAP